MEIVTYIIVGVLIFGCAMLIEKYVNEHNQRVNLVENFSKLLEIDSEKSKALDDLASVIDEKYVNQDENGHISDLVKHLLKVIAEEGDLKIYNIGIVRDDEGDYMGKDAVSLDKEDIDHIFEVANMKPEDFDFDYKKHQAFPEPLPEAGKALIYGEPY